MIEKFLCTLGELADSNIPLFTTEVQRSQRGQSRNQTFTTEAQRTQSEEMILSAAEAADKILHADSRHGE
ncbi:MAG: hypothetical protein GX433_04025 [Deltaproteobacteria bacterium]|nr:hypothetical protein [Deltaproteobacteria bacterium]